MWLVASAIGVGVHPTTSLMFLSEMVTGPEGDLFTPEERKEIENRMTEMRGALVPGSDAPFALVFRLIAGPEMPDTEKTPRRPLAYHLEILPADEPATVREDGR
jgi:hypothetical protein